MAATTAERGRTESASRAQPSKRPNRISFNGRLMAPALIVLALLSLFPFVYIVLMSLSRVGLIGGIDLHWAGLDNWSKLSASPRSGRRGSARSSTSCSPSGSRWRSGSRSR